MNTGQEPVPDWKGGNVVFCRVLSRCRVFFLRAQMRHSGQRLIHLALVEESLLRLEHPGVQDTDGFAIRAINADNSDAARRHAQIEEPRLNPEPW